MLDCFAPNQQTDEAEIGLNVYAQCQIDRNQNYKQNVLLSFLRQNQLGSAGVY